MTDFYVKELQKHFVTSFKEQEIRYYTNRVDDAPLPYVKLWELNSWNEEYKTHNEVEVRFTFWLWDYPTATKSTFELLQKLSEISNNAVNVIPEIMVVEKEKEAIRDAQKPDTKCTVVVYKFKIYGGK